MGEGIGDVRLGENAKNGGEVFDISWLRCSLFLSLSLSLSPSLPPPPLSLSLSPLSLSLSLSLTPNPSTSVVSVINHFETSRDARASTYIQGVPSARRLGWVYLNFQCFTLCLGSLEFGRSGRAGEQDG